MKNKSIFSSRRFKYGTAAIVFTAVFVAAIIAFNVIFSTLANTYRWYIDMTKEQIYDVSPEMHVLLDDLGDVDIKIIFCSPADQLDSNTYQQYVHTYCKNLANEFDYISVDYIDIITNPSSYNPYATTTATKPKTTNVIITNGSDYRVFYIEAFYTFAQSDNSVFAFNAEYKIASAILQMQNDNPIAYFTTNHGESVDNTPLWNLFSDAGFEVRKIDLTKEDIEDAAKIVIVNGPLYDFMGAYDTVNEIGKLDNFVDRYGSLMVFLDPNTQDMPELEELLSEWGIGFGDAVIKDYSNAISTDATALVAEYPTEGLGASLHTTLRELETPPKTIVRYSRPVEMLWTDYNGRNVSQVLTTTKEAKSYSTLDDSETASGPFTLMALSCELRYVNNNEMYTYVLAGGTSLFSDAKYLESNAYGNKDILSSVMKALGKEKVPIDLDFKVFDDNSLDITTAEATKWTIVYTLLLPIIVSGLGVAVWLRRRHL